MLVYAGTQYWYGRNGDLQTKITGTDTTKYTYDAFGNLMQVVMPDGDVIQYVIDGQNRRIGERVNGRWVHKWLYAGQLTPIAELDSTDNIITRFSGGYMNKRDTIYQIITDHLGSVRLVTNVTNGTIAQRIDYDEFGNVTYDSNPGFQPFGFAGGLYDPETKLVRFGARDYDAETGRWTSKDPIGFEGGVSNLFEYALCDPIDLIDIFGLQQTYTGQASYYNLPGDNTASGVPFDANAMAAAMTANRVPHIPTQVTVTYTYQSKDSKGCPKTMTNTVTVTVNDRGPFALNAQRHALYPLQPNPTRIIDLIPAAFRQLTGSLNQGVVQVTVTVGGQRGTSGGGFVGGGGSFGGYGAGGSW